MTTKVIFPLIWVSIRLAIFHGARSGHEHWRDTYACKHPSHDSGEECHVSVCNEHKKDPENNKLLNRFNEEFIQEKVYLPNKMKKVKNY